MVNIKSILASALVLPLLTSALQITTPSLTTLATTGQNLTVSWTSVDTDPSTFGVLLVNFVYVSFEPLFCFGLQPLINPSVATHLHSARFQRPGIFQQYHSPHSMRHHTD
jgi:hypothetical protein